MPDELTLDNIGPHMMNMLRIVKEAAAKRDIAEMEKAHRGLVLLATQVIVLARRTL